MSVFEKILVPVDYSGGAESALHYARVLAMSFNARVDVLHVWKSPVTIAPEPGLRGPYPAEVNPEALAEREAESFLDVLLTNVEIENDSRFRKLAVPGSPVRVILDRAVGYDLIIMGTHGRRGISRVVLGSVAEKVVRRAPCPVLVIHP